MKKAFSITGIVVGSIIVLWGIVILQMSIEGNYLAEVKFGADFYTDAYKGIKAASDNVCDVARILRDGIGSILIAIGATDICFFGLKLVEKNETAAPVIVNQETPIRMDEELPDL